jgi:hypothetical protein
VVESSTSNPGADQRVALGEAPPAATARRTGAAAHAAGTEQPADTAGAAAAEEGPRAVKAQPKES